MPITQSLNSKANVKKFTNQDLPFAPQQPVINSYYAVSTAGQTVINLSFSVDTVNLSDQFFLFVDGKKLRLGASNDYTFTSVGSNGYSSQVTINYGLPINLNIQAYQLGLKKESEFNMDNRFVQLYEAQGNGFQGFVNTVSFSLSATTTTGTPAAGTFYSSITNRAPLVDLSQDLKPRMGIERISVQNIFLIQNEQGPNSEQIWGVQNDTLGQIRFAGVWGGANTNISNGIYQYSTTVGDFVEVTFYGTGLNVLWLYDGTLTRNVTASVDGGADGSNLVVSSISNILDGRNYSPNIITRVTSGLTLGIHTVRLKGNSTDGFPGIMGFEILNESSLVKIPPGVSYLQGKKYTSSALQSFSYSAPVTGSRGGRVLVYQNGDGTIGTAFQAAGSQLNLSSADHTNEEVARVYSFREFGAGRSDDFSGNFSNSTLAFTLEDDSTNMNGTSLQWNPSSQVERLETISSSGFYEITFVGTGLDILRLDDGNTTVDSHTVTVDGSSIGTITGTASTNPRIQKIVSGLPYGSHVVRIARTATAAFGVGARQLIVYQPKKPALPSGTVELADYNVMANYVANSTAGLDNIATGVLRKFFQREATYVGTFVAQTIDPTLFVGGWRFDTTTNGSYYEYTFFGTGFEARGRASTGWSATNTVSLQALSTGGSLQTLNSTNFPGLTTSSYGGWTYTYSSGNLAVGGSNTVGSGMAVSGLPLGLYKVRFAEGTTNSFGVEALDIITPIHSHKSNLYGDVQNTLPIGSQSISDNRKTTPVKDVLPAQKAWAQAVGVVSAPTTTSTSPVPFTDMSLTLKTNGGPIEVQFQANVSNGTVNGSVFLQIYVDGVAYGIPGQLQAQVNGGYNNIVSTSAIIPVAPGTHKIDGYWWIATGNGATNTTQRIIKAREI
jgi:hypothetical protein